MNTYCGTGLANPRNPRGLTLAWDHNVYVRKERREKQSYAQANPKQIKSATSTVHDQSRIEKNGT